MAARKKVDSIRTGHGYGDRLRYEGLARALVSPEDVRPQCMMPENSPAYIRGQVIREWADDTITWVTWTLRLREDGKSRIVSLDDYRNREH